MSETEDGKERGEKLESSKSGGGVKEKSDEEQSTQTTPRGGPTLSAIQSSPRPAPMKKFAFLGKRQAHMSAANLNLRESFKKKEASWEKTDLFLSKPPSFKETNFESSSSISLSEGNGESVRATIPVRSVVSSVSVLQQKCDENPVCRNARVSSTRSPSPSKRKSPSPSKRKSPSPTPMKSSSPTIMKGLSPSIPKKGSSSAIIPSPKKNGSRTRSTSRKGSSSRIGGSGSDGESDEGDDGEDEDDEEKKEDEILSAEDSQSTLELAFVELIETEQYYRDCLRITIDLYLSPLKIAKGEILKPSYINILFANIEEIYHLCLGFLDRLKKSFCEWKEIWEQKKKGSSIRFERECPIHDAFEYLYHNTETFMKYGQASENAIKFMNELKRSAAERKRFSKFVEFAMSQIQDPSSKNLSLDMLIIMPIQRLPRYTLLLNVLKEHTPTTDPEELESIKQSLETAFKLCKDIDDSQDSDRLAQVLSVQRKIGAGCPELVTPRRKFIFSDRCSLFAIDNIRVRFVGNLGLYLFNDILCLSLQKKFLTLLRLEDLWVVEFPQQKSRHSFSSHTLLQPTCCHLCRKFIYGLRKQCLRCGHCGTIAHESCQKKKPGICLKALGMIGSHPFRIATPSLSFILSTRTTDKKKEMMVQIADAVSLLISQDRSLVERRQRLLHESGSKFFHTEADFFGIDEQWGLFTSPFLNLSSYPLADVVGKYASSRNNARFTLVDGKVESDQPQQSQSCPKLTNSSLHESEKEEIREEDDHSIFELEQPVQLTIHPLLEKAVSQFEKKKEKERRTSCEKKPKTHNDQYQKLNRDFLKRSTSIRTPHKIVSDDGSVCGDSTLTRESDSANQGTGDRSLLLSPYRSPRNPRVARVSRLGGAGGGGGGGGSSVVGGGGKSQDQQSEKKLFRHRDRSAGSYVVGGSYMNKAEDSTGGLSDKDKSLSDGGNTVSRKENQTSEPLNPFFFGSDQNTTTWIDPTLLENLGNEEQPATSPPEKVEFAPSIQSSFDAPNNWILSSSTALQSDINWVDEPLPLEPQIIEDVTNSTSSLSLTSNPSSLLEIEPAFNPNQDVGWVKEEIDVGWAKEEIDVGWAKEEIDDGGGITEEKLNPLISEGNEDVQWLGAIPDSHWLNDEGNGGVEWNSSWLDGLEEEEESKQKKIAKKPLVITAPKKTGDEKKILDPGREELIDSWQDSGSWLKSRDRDRCSWVITDSWETIVQNHQEQQEQENAPK